MTVTVSNTICRCFSNSCTYVWAVRAGKKMIQFSVKPIVLIIFAGLSGCTTHVTLEEFKKSYDRDINEVFYTHERDEYQEPIKLKNGMLKFNSIKYSNGCQIYWIVTPSKNRKYYHPNGMIFEIEGLRKDWGFISDPSLCNFTFRYRGAFAP